MKKLFLLLIIFAGFFTFINVYAGDYRIVYDYDIDVPGNNYYPVNVIATNDGGYAILTCSAGDFSFNLVKYSVDGVKEWDTVIKSVGGRGEQILNLVQLENNNYMLVGNKIGYKLGEDGNIITSFSINNFNDDAILGCVENNSDIICTGQSFDPIMDNSIVVISSDGLVKKVYSDMDYVGPFSIFKDDSGKINIAALDNYNLQGNYYLYKFDTNLNLISKEQTSKILIFGQGSNGNYYGMKFIKEQSTTSNSFLLSQVFLDGSLNIVAEKKIADPFDLELYGQFLEFKLILPIIRSMVSDKKYLNSKGVSQIDFELDDSGQYLLFSYFKDNYSLDNIAKIYLGSLSLANYNDEYSFGFEFPLVTTLKSGDEVAIFGLGEEEIKPRHIKISNRFSVEFSSSNSNAYFDNSSYAVGDVVKINLKKIDGYTVDKIIVKDSDGNEIAVNMDDYTFVMPSSNVKVDVQWKEVLNPTTGALLSTLLCIITIMLIGILNYKYFKKKV